MNIFKLNLTSAAKKSGGDKYSGDLGDEKPTDIYIPQNISRELTNKPISYLNFILSDEEIDNSYKIELTKQAKSKGGDKYEGNIKGEVFNVYLPQKISRKNKDIITKIYVSFDTNSTIENPTYTYVDKDNIIKNLEEENIMLKEEIEKLREQLQNHYS